MAFAPAWRRRAAARWWRRGARMDASASAHNGRREPCSFVAAAAVERLKQRRDFRAAASGLRASAGAFVVQARRRGDEGPPRIGFTVSKQVGNAVERNRVRRRLREIVRLSSAATAAAERSPVLRHGHDYVLIGRRAALGVPFADLLQEFTTAVTSMHRSRRAGTGSSLRRPLHEAGSPPPPGGHGASETPETPQKPSEDPGRSEAKSPE